MNDALAGFATSLALIVAIGSQNAFVLRQGILREHVLPLVVFCALSDALLILVGVAGGGALVQQYPVALEVARIGGALFLAAYALFAARRALHPAAELALVLGQVAERVDVEELDVELDSDEGGDALEMDDTEEFKSETMPMEEAVNLQAAPKPVTTEPAGTNTKSTVTANSGAKGAAASPVKMTGDTAQGRSAPKTGELIGKVQNSVGGDKKMTPATKPHLAQATGVNTKTPFPKA